MIVSSAMTTDLLSPPDHPTLFAILLAQFIFQKIIHFGRFKLLL